MSADPADTEPQAARARVIDQCRERVRLEDIARAKDDLYAELHPVQCHLRAAMASLEADDDSGAEHQLRLAFEHARGAWTAWGALKRAQELQSKRGSA